MGKILIEVTDIHENKVGLTSLKSLCASTKVEIEGVSTSSIGAILSDIIVNVANQVKDKRKFYDFFVEKIADDLPLD